MANEAVILELNEFMDAKQYTVAASTSISKGTLLKLSGDNTVSASSSDGDVYAGVAAADKDGTDSSTTLAVYTPGQGNKFDMKVNGVNTVTLGAMVRISNANVICDAVDGDFEAGEVIGKAMEAGDAAEVIAVLS